MRCDFNTFPWLFQNFYDLSIFHDFSRPGNDHFKIPWLFQVFHDRTNPAELSRPERRDPRVVWRRLWLSLRWISRHRFPEKLRHDVKGIKQTTATLIERLHPSFLGWRVHLMPRRGPGAAAESAPPGASLGDCIPPRLAQSPQSASLRAGGRSWSAHRAGGTTRPSRGEVYVCVGLNDILNVPLLRDTTQQSVAACYRRHYLF